MNGKNQNIVGNQYGCLTVQKLAYKKEPQVVLYLFVRVIDHPITNSAVATYFIQQYGQRPSDGVSNPSQAGAAIDDLVNELLDALEGHEHRCRSTV